MGDSDSILTQREKMKLFYLAPALASGFDFSSLIANYKPVFTFTNVVTSTSDKDAVQDQDQDLDVDVTPEPAIECQDYWVPAEDNQSCVPEPEMVKTTCGGNTMTVQFDAKVLRDGQDIDAAYFGDDKEDDKCKPALGPDGWEITFGLDDCGTALEYDEEAETLNYNAQMVIPGKEQGFIFFDEQMTWVFTCSYSTQYEVTDEITMATTASKYNFAGAGSFEIDLSFYQSDLFENKAEDEPFMIGKPVNFGISFNGGVPLNNLVFVPGNCEVINLENEEEFFQVWNSGNQDELSGMCAPGAMNPVNFEILQNPSDEKAFYGMQYRGFAFGSVAGSEGQQQLKCLVNVCHVDICTSACKLGCFQDDECEGSGEGSAEGSADFLVTDDEDYIVPQIEGNSTDYEEYLGYESVPQIEGNSTDYEEYL